MNKITIEHIDNIAKKRNWELLSTEYIRCSEKLKFKCPEGHICWISWDNFKREKGCKTCFVNNHVKKFKYDIKYIEEQINLIGYTLLSTTYNNNSQKLKIKCDKDHIFYMPYGKIQQGKRCPVCFDEHRKKKQKEKINMVKIDADKRNYQIISIEDETNCRTYLNFLCSNNHKVRLRIDHFLEGHGCKKCRNKRYTKRIYKEIKEYIESYDYKLLSEEYIKHNEKLKLQCPEGHIYETIFNVFRKGHRCPTCHYIKRKKLYNEVKQYIELYDYKLLSEEYIKHNEKLKLQCPLGHIFKMSYNHFQQGQRCSVCYYQSSSSEPERELQDFVSTIYNGNIKLNDRTTIINPLTGWNLELDVYLSELNKAIEFNGSYWHSLPDSIERDRIKQEQCKYNDINLLTIHEDNWVNNKEMCLQVIENFINQT